MTAWDDEWVEGLQSWEEAEDVLVHAVWEVAGAPGCDLQVERTRSGLAVVPTGPAVTAAQRRGLHRAGFRLSCGDWLWPMPDPPAPDVLRRPPLPDVAGRISAWVAARRAREQRLGEQAVLVLRDVLRLPVASVVVRLPLAHDPYEDEPEDDGDGGTWERDAGGEGTWTAV